MADDAFKRRLETFESAHRPAEAVDTNKINFFAAGNQKKSKREREKEAAEAKRLKEEEDAALAYKEFVASFDDPSGDREHGPKGFKPFVRAGGSGPSSMSPPTGPSSTATSSSGFRPIVPTGPRAQQQQQQSNPLAPPSGPRASIGRAAFNQQPSPAAFMDDEGPAERASLPPARRKRAMDSFLEELKRDQDSRERRLESQVRAGVVTSVSAAAAQDLSRTQGPSAGGSYDTGDSSTTNLHVGNLPANVTINALGMHFAQFGPVASVKIMWPREQGGASIGAMSNAASFAATRAGLNGFIAFMKRSDAQRALDKCDGVEWGGSILQLGWGKAMPLPPRPTFVSSTPYQRSDRSQSPPPKRSRMRSRSISPRRSYDEDKGKHSRHSRPSRAGSRSDDSRGRSHSRSPHDRPSKFRKSDYRDSLSQSRSRSPSVERRGGRNRSMSRSMSPRERRWPKLESREMQGRLEDTAEKIKQYGKRYEDTLRDKERNNPNYDFLRDERLPAYHYFKMLLDSRYRPPPPPPPPFQDEGNQDILSSDDSELESQMKQNKRGVLGRLPRAKLEAMLRTLTNTREKIARVMTFALDRPDAAEEVSDVLIQSLLIGSTPVPRKIARLSVISDILHNCAGTPTNAWKYRSLFETKLPPVFTHFGEIYKSFPGRMKAEVFRKQITTITQVWEQWLVFNPSVLADLDKRLTTGEEAASDLPPQQVTATIDEYIQEPVRPSGPAAGFLVVNSGRAENSSQQEPQNQDDDIDGEALEPASGAMQEDDVDGDPIDGDDIDGAPL